MRVSWEQFKNFCSNRNIPMHERELENNLDLLVEAFDGPVSRTCILKEDDDPASDYQDYVVNFQAAANTSYTDSNGVTYQRTKITRTGWHFQVHGVELGVGLLGACYNKDENGNDLGFASVKYYDVNDVELVAGTQIELTSNCVKTVCDIEVDQDIEVIGGIIEQAVPPTGDVRVWVTAIPDLPVVAGGSVPFTQGGINLKHISGSLDIDGKTPKLLPYNATYHTNKFRITARHAIGVTHTIQILLKLFRENV